MFYLVQLLQRGFQPFADAEPLRLVLVIRVLQELLQAVDVALLAGERERRRD